MTAAAARGRQGGELVKVIIAGSRDVADYRVVSIAVLRAWHEWGQPEIDEVLSGAARGVDQLGERWAEQHRIPIRRFLAAWTKHGKAAGPLRNQQMADACEPGVDGLVAIPSGESRGTRDMIRRAQQRCLRVYVCEVGEQQP